MLLQNGSMLDESFRDTNSLYVYNFTSSWVSINLETERLVNAF